jgi:hypothetical protein
MRFDMGRWTVKGYYCVSIRSQVMMVMSDNVHRMKNK